MAVGYQRAGMASGAVNTARQLGNALGIAVLGVVFHAGLTSSVRGSGVARPTAVADAVASGQAEGVLARSGAAQRSGLEHVVHAAFASGLRSAFLAAAIMGVVGGLAVLALVRRPNGEQAAGPAGGETEWSQEGARMPAEV
jgi:hypothetical protein